MGIFSALPLKCAHSGLDPTAMQKGCIHGCQQFGVRAYSRNLGRTLACAFRGSLVIQIRELYRPVVVRGEETKVPIRRLTQASDFARLDCAAVLHFMVVSGSEAARAVGAELEGYLIDRAEGLAQLSNTERHASDEAAFDFVRRLEQLGCAVCVGVDQADLRFDDDPSKTRAYDLGCLV